MNTGYNTLFDEPVQKLPRETYYDPDWFEREKRELFDHAWIYACTEDLVPEPGDYFCFRYMAHTLFVLRDGDGDLRAFYNICRHRGCEVLEDSGNTGSTIRCPYHRWTYELDGRLRSVPNEDECFGEVARADHSLRKARVGVYRGIVFVNPSHTPADTFEAWIANMDDEAWPHSFTDGSMKYSGHMYYEMHCNWKIFYENAIDGYHLGYLHDKTLGKVYPDRNIWKPVGRNVVWYSTERDGDPQAKTILSDEQARGSITLPGHEKPNYPGVVMLFPLTILSPSPWGFYISVLEPISPEITNMHVYSWTPDGVPGQMMAGKDTEPVRLADLDYHPLESGNFQIEDMWIVEKIQRAIRSPHFKVGPLAKGDGAEGPITHFQDNVLDIVPLK